MRWIPKPAQYLLRVDDLCPTVSRNGWLRCSAICEQHGVHPILGVVPDNRDPELDHGVPNGGFWEEMARMEAKGATIALHGYTHRCQSHGRSLIDLHRESEFAGVEPETQRLWIRRGREILQQRGLNPRIWIAPRHGFDGNTLRALRDEGLLYLSDGFGRRPFVRGGVTWIPQQLWAPVSKRNGLWTICIHPNSVTDEDWNRLERFLERYAGQFTSFERLIGSLDARELSLCERLFEEASIWRVRLRRTRTPVRNDQSRLPQRDGEGRPSSNS